MIRVLITDDSITVRKVVADRLQAVGIQVAGEACDGAEAVALTRRIRPDVVLMDVVMPRMDGLDATRQIMATVPTPVVILSGYATRKEVFKTWDALTAGALEVCAKPSATGGQSGTEWRRLITTIKAAARVDVTTIKRQSTATDVRRIAPSLDRTEPTVQRSLVIIGASTGGPTAVKRLLLQLTTDFGLPVLLAIHCARQTAVSLAGWFDEYCALTVRDARHEDRLDHFAGTVLTAPPGYHLTIVNRRIVLTEAIETNVYTPSIDRLFMSAAACYGHETIGILLTGMGADGAAGLKQIHNHGGLTIVQNEASSVVFGMPGAAIKLGAVDQVASPEQIAQLLAQECPSTNRRDIQD